MDNRICESGPDKQVPPKADLTNTPLRVESRCHANPRGRTVSTGRGKGGCVSEHASAIRASQHERRIRDKVILGSQVSLAAAGVANAEPGGIAASGVAAKVARHGASFLLDRLADFRIFRSTGGERVPRGAVASFGFHFPGGNDMLVSDPRPAWQSRPGKA